MRRVVSLWLPTLATDRLRPSNGPAEAPRVTRQHDGRRMVIAAADARAQALGLQAGMALAHAQAMITGLEIHDADPVGDAAALRRLAAWCLRLAPLTAPDTDGVWIDATGSAHLHGGETAMLERLLARLAQDGIAARAALADTPGAAHALARYGTPGGPLRSHPAGPKPDDRDLWLLHPGSVKDRHARRAFACGPFEPCIKGGPCLIVPPGASMAAIAGLPVAALRLDAETSAALRRLGFETVGALDATPRAPLARRFGAAVLLRLDQAAGRVAEPITPVIPPEVPAQRIAFAEPLLTAEAFAAVIGRLTRQVCAGMERTGQGARQVDLLFERVDGSAQAVRIGTARPTRDPRHLGRLLEEQIETVDPGLGVDAMHLIVPLAEPLAYAQTANLAAEPEPDLAALVDRLSNRLGAGRVWRAAPVQSDVPERSVRRVPALSLPGGGSWPRWPRPARLLTPPQPVEALALLPDHPPKAFTWRQRRHRVHRADGPERIAGEWWRRDAETAALRDYWQVEDQAGRRFWLYRRGDGMDQATGDLQWFVHGVF